MRAAILLICSLLCLPVFAATPTARDLVGKWEGTAVFGKMKFKMVLRIVETNDNRIAATMDLPEHGQRGMPIGAVLFNAPEVRIEIDPFQTAYNAELSEDLSTMNGEFEEGPGGRPIGIVFKRSSTKDEPEPEQVFTFQPGEERDIRGHWKASVEPMPGMKLTAGLNIGRIADGSFKATMDILEQGAKDIPAGSVAQSGRDVEIKWDALQMNFTGKLSEDGNRIEGEMKQRGKPEAVTFARINSRATLAAANVSFESNPADPNDIRGEWAGKLDIPNQKLRLILKLGKTPEGEFAGSLSSPDQGPGELPMGSAKVELPKVTMEWPGIRGKFEGVLTNEGSVLEGTWEQFGNKMPLKLERSKPQSNNGK